MLKKVAIAGVAAFSFLLVVGLMVPQKSPEQRITEGCRREFGERGDIAVNDCRIKLMIRTIDRAEADKLERADH
jgi:hypothetical protein